MTDFLHIDGSRGEGGGQVIRTSLALALVTGRPVAFDRIRAGREKPGLMRQHLTAVNAAAEICGGSATGAAIGARSFTFEPRAVRAGNYRFSVGSAGSATLVLQTVLPALLTAGGPSTVVLEGGTHNPWAPPFDFLQKAYLPLINRMGPQVTIELDRAGFYPAGGGRFRVRIAPAAAWNGFDLRERGEIIGRSARVLLANLPAHIARREMETIVKKTGWDAGLCSIEEVDAAGPGNAVVIELASRHVTEVFVAFGERGVKAERVAEDAVRQAREYLAADVPVGHYLADQLMLPLGISAWQEEGGGDAGRQGAGTAMRRRGGAFRTLALSRHATTQIDLLREFLGVSIAVEPSADGGSCTVLIRPPGG